MNCMIFRTNEVQLINTNFVQKFLYENEKVGEFYLLYLEKEVSVNCEIGGYKLNTIN